VQKIFQAAEAPIEWDVQIIGKEVDPRTNSFVTRENLDSVLVRAAAPYEKRGWLTIMFEKLNRLVFSL
jgi:hypothetical protein